MYSTWGDVNEIIHKLPNDRGIRFEKITSGDFKVSAFGVDDLVKLSKDEKLFHAVCDAKRPGAEYYFQYLEYTYFTPTTPENEEYEYRLFKWDEMYYAIGSIPINKMRFVQETAAVASLKAQMGAVPFSTGRGFLQIRGALNPEKTKEGQFAEVKDLISWFPLNCKQMCTLETADGSSPLYEPGGRADLYAEYDYKLKQLLENRGLSWEDYKGRGKE